MTQLFFILLFVAGPFWSEKAPADWTARELNELLTNSPWAQYVTGPGIARLPPIHMFLATAGPILAAEAEAKRRAGLDAKPAGLEARPDPIDTDYRDWLAENSSTQFVLAVHIEDTYAFNNAKEAAQFEKDSVMRIGRRKIPMTGYFPPSAADPYVRIAFPRAEVQATDKELRFELYLPGVTGPFRSIEFKPANLVVDGRLEL